MATGDLTTLANVKAWPGIAGNASDALLSRLITSASSWIADVTSRSFISGNAVSEIRDGTGGQELLLSGPVTAITSVIIDTLTIPAQTANGQPGYFLSGNVLCLEGYTFTRARKNVRLAYVNGYATVPADIEQACIELVVSAYKRGPRGPDLSDRSVMGQSHKWSLQDTPLSVQRCLSRYSKVAPV